MRPTMLAINAIISFVVAVLLLIVGVWCLVTSGDLFFANPDAFKGPSSLLMLLTGVSALVVGLVFIAAGVGQLLKKNWGRIVGLVGSGLVLLFIILSFIAAFMMMGSSLVKELAKLQNQTTTTQALGLTEIGNNLSDKDKAALQQVVTKLQDSNPKAQAADLVKELAKDWPISPWLVLIVALVVLVFAAWNLIYLFTASKDILAGASGRQFSVGISSTLISSTSTDTAYNPPATVGKTVGATQGTGFNKGGAKMDPKTKLMDMEEAVNAWVIITRGRQEGREFRLRNTSNLGRHQSNCDVVLTDDLVSTEHARIKMDGKQFYLHDLASSNGTYLNGRRIQQRELLMDGDQIRIGDTTLVFKRT